MKAPDIRQMCGTLGVLGEPSASLGACDVQAITRLGRHDPAISYAGGNRLAVGRVDIIDFSRRHQPLTNQDGTVVVALSRKIYNDKGLRAWLEGKGHHFPTRSDAAILVHVHEKYRDVGVHRLHGMCAFALWHTDRGRLLLAPTS